MKQYRLLRALKIAVFATAAVTIGGFLVMSLWNVLMPSIFAVRAISFSQALGLLVLSKILFGGFRPHVGSGPRWRRHMRERWEQMTPEERDKFKQGLRRSCGPRQKVGAPNKEAEAQA